MKPLRILIIVVVLALPLQFVWRGLHVPKLPGLSDPASKTNRKPVQSSAGTPVNGGSLGANLRKLLESGELPKLSAEQLNAFVEKQKHSAASLLAAWQLGEDSAWLDEAVQRYPDDPRVALAKLGTMKEIDDSLVQDMLKLAKTVRGEGGDGFLITKLVGSAMERKMLAELSTLDLIPGTREFVLERLGELDAEKNLVRSLVQKTGPLLPALDDSELKQYFKRSAVEGELKAMQWLLSRHPEAK